MPDAARQGGMRRESARAVRQQLDRVLSSGTFRQVARLKRFLAFVVQESLDGRAGQLKEYVIGVHVFDRESSFDPRTDPIVRVQARRLRSRLARYYQDEGRHDELVIELPKGGYAPVFHLEDRGAAVEPSASSPVTQNTIAVRAIDDHSAAHDLEYLCDGLRQELLVTLSTCEGLRVVSPLTAQGPGRASVQPAFEVLGSVRAAGQQLRVTTHIVDRASGLLLASDSVDGTVDDPLALQDAAAAVVRRRLESDLIDAARGRRSARPPENLSARNLYLQGRYHLDQRTEEGLKRSVEFFEKALAEDPQYSLAHSGLSDAFGLLGHYGVLGPADVWTRAASSAASAVMLDPSSSEARTSVAHMKATQDWDWASAEREFRHAISLDPGYATAHHWYAMSCLIPLGRLDDALHEITMAQGLDPVSSIVARDIATIHLYRRDLDAALEQCDHTVELNPYFSAAYWTLGLIQEQRQELEEATAAYTRGLHLSPESPRMHAALGRVLALTGDVTAGARVIRKLRSFAAHRYVSPVEFACVQLAIGQIELALRSLTKAARDRAFDLLALKFDPRFDALRGNDRFDATVRLIGLD
jgi:TolB-like protein/Tfp pilus assembly protein PilF